MLNMDRIESTQLTTNLGLRMHVMEIATVTCFSSNTVPGLPL